MEYEKFRKDFSAIMSNIDTEITVGFLIRYAEAYPTLVKEPYRFLAEACVSYSEKLTAIGAVRAVAMASDDNLFE